MLGQMLLTPDAIVQDFALILLRAAVCGGVPAELIPVLQFMFTEFFAPRSFTGCLPVAKIFLELLPTVDVQALDELFSTGMPHVGYIQGHLTPREQFHFAVGLDIANGLLTDDDVCDDPKPLMNNLSVTIGETNDPDDGLEVRIPPCGIRFQPVFFSLDQFACVWQKKEDVAPLIQRVFSPLAIRDMVTSEYESAIEFGLIMLRLVVSNDVDGEAVDVLKFVFLEVFPVATPVIRLYIAKVFMTMALNMGASMYDGWVPVEMANEVRDCIEADLTDLEQEHYATAIDILEELIGRQRLDRERKGHIPDELDE
jgi:hypothetical protein